MSCNVFAILNGKTTVFDRKSNLQGCCNFAFMHFATAHLYKRKGRYMKKILCAFLTTVILLTAVSCSREQSNSPDTSDEEQIQAQDTDIENGENSIKIVCDGTSQYTIIYPSGARDDTLYFASKALSDEIKKVSGVSIHYANDYQAASECEILIGATKRTESPSSSSFSSELDWNISITGKKIIISGGSDKAVEAAVKFFTEQYVKGSEISVPFDLNHSYHSEYSVLKIAEVYSKLKVTGRHSIKNEGITCDWSAAGIEFNAVCQGYVRLKLSVTTGDAYFAAYVDGTRVGTRLKAAQGESTIEIVKNLAQGEHNIRLVKLNHIYQSNTVLKELELAGSLSERPEDKNTYIEFIGDSITCGVGLSETPAYGANGSDATRAYSYVCAQKLGADYSMVSVSGHTLSWSTSNPTLSVPNYFYPYINHIRDNTPYDFANSRTPDVVVINLGTNDEGKKNDLNITDEIFEQDLRSFLTKIRTNYSESTPIVFVTNTMSDGFKNVIGEVCADLGGESSGYYIYEAIRNNGALGNHPDKAAMQTVGNGLAEFLEQKNLV